MLDDGDNLLLVNADDLGLSKPITDAILAGFEKGYIDAASLMVNFDQSTLYAVGQIRRLSKQTSIGLHLNLTEGVPLTEDIKNVSSFCTNGVFNKRFSEKFLKTFFLTKKERLAVRKEIEAQMSLFFTLLPNANKHLDSHHHIHTKPSIWRICRLCCVEHSFTSVRISRNFPSVKNPFKRFYKFLFNTIMLRQFNHTAYFTSAFSYVNAKKHPRGSVEIMCHPRKAGEFLAQDPYQRLHGTTSNG